MSATKHILLVLAMVGCAHAESQRAVELANAGAMYRAQGRLADAEPLLEEAIAIFEKCRDECDSGFPRVLTHAALVTHELGDDARAEVRARRALEILEWAATGGID